MSEIVYTYTDRNRLAVDDTSASRKALDVKSTVFKAEDKVSVVTSILVTGRPFTARNKRYYYWITTGSLGFKRSSTGKVIPYHCARPFDATRSTPWKFIKPWQPFEWLADNTDAGFAFRMAMRDVFDINTQNDIYPMMEQAGIPKYSLIPTTLHDSFRSDNWDEFTAKAFGKKRANTRLTNAVKNTEPYFVAFAQQFRGLVDDDKLVLFLENNNFDEEMEQAFWPHSPNIRPGLLVASQDARELLISNRFTAKTLYQVRDVCSFGKKRMQRYFYASNSVTGRNMTGLLSMV